MTTVIKYIGFAFLAFAVNSQATDLAKEKRWASQIVDSIMDGDAEMLNDGKSEFLSIYTEAGEDKGRAAIVMHGTGIHPDWQLVIQPLRVGLTEHNWHTLAIQMPILPNEAEYIEYAPLYDEVAPRIEAAIEFLKGKGAETIVLVGHSQGASMPAYSLSKNGHDVAGFVAIGIGAYADDERMDSIKALEGINIPVLDIYGSEDLDTVLVSIDDRAAAAGKAGNANYSQVEVPGAGHLFEGKEDALLEAIADWLEKLTAN